MLKYIVSIVDVAMFGNRKGIGANAASPKKSLI